MKDHIVGRLTKHSCALVYLTPPPPHKLCSTCCTRNRWRRNKLHLWVHNWYSSTTSTAPHAAQRKTRPRRGQGQKCAGNWEPLILHCNTVTLRAPIILCNTVTPRAPILHRARESPCDRPQTRGQGVLLRPSTFWTIESFTHFLCGKVTQPDISIGCFLFKM